MNRQSRTDFVAWAQAHIAGDEKAENLPWSGEANVHVSIANWVKTRDPALLPATRRLWFKTEPALPARRRRSDEGPASRDCRLDMRECAHINSALPDQRDVSGAKVLLCNTDPQKSFAGQFPRRQAPGDAVGLHRGARGRAHLHCGGRRWRHRRFGLRWLDTALRWPR